MFGPDRPPTDGGITVNVPELREKMIPLLAKASTAITANEVVHFIKNAEKEGKSTLMKDHASMMFPYEPYKFPCGASEPDSPYSHTNPTAFSDDFMETLCPIFLIRHPVWMIPSLYREVQRAFKITVADKVWKEIPKWTASRVLFDWYAAGDKGIPIVVNYEDFINDTKSIMTQLCSITGVDESGLQYTWAIEKNPYPDWPEAFRSTVEPWFGSVNESTGIRRSPKQDREPNLDDESKAWAVEFGDDVARELVISCKEAMDDYLYLRRFSLHRDRDRARD